MNTWIHSLSVTLLLVGLGLPVQGAMPSLEAHSGTAMTQSANDEAKQLLTVIRDEWMIQNEPDRVLQAIKRLGELKSTEAINDLTRLLTFRRTFEWEGTERAEMMEGIHLITPGERYPAVGALFEIGKPSLPALIEVIKTHDSNSLEGSNAWRAVMIIFRDTPSSAVEYLRKAGAKASSPEARRRLSYAVDKASDLAKKLTRQ